MFLKTMVAGDHYRIVGGILMQNDEGVIYGKNNSGIYVIPNSIVSDIVFIRCASGTSREHS